MSFIEKTIHIKDELTIDRSFIFLIVTFYIIFSMSLIEFLFLLDMHKLEKACSIIPDLFLSPFLIYLFVNLNIKITAIKKETEKDWKKFDLINTEDLSGLYVKFEDFQNSKSFLLDYDKEKKSICIKGNYESISFFYDSNQCRNKIDFA